MQEQITVSIRGTENWMFRILQSKFTFVILQALDLLTTLAAFHVGAFEFNPLVARLTNFFGPVGGVVCSKAIAILIAFRLRKLVWVVNVFYSGIIIWNLIVLFALSARH
jgi:hypothetical protein